MLTPDKFQMGFVQYGISAFIPVFSYIVMVLVKGLGDVQGRGEEG